MTGQIYTITDFKNIYEKEGHCNLEQNIIQLLKDLESSLNIPADDLSKPIKKSGDFGLNRSKQHNNRNYQSNGDEDWSTLRSYVPTATVKKEGIEKDMNTIRGHLNKLSAKNYESQSLVIFAFLDTFFENEDESGQNLRKITQTFFDIVNMNKNNSDIYADLYRSLIEKYSVFTQILAEFTLAFKKSVQNIQYIDPNTDYDKFCAYMKLNEQRRTSALFLVNLMKRSVISNQSVVDIILFFQDQLFAHINDECRTNEVEEIGETVFVFISQSHKVLKTHESWDTKILANVRHLSVLNTKEHAGLSNRALFKCMDILDLLK